MLISSSSRIIFFCINTLKKKIKSQGDRLSVERSLEKKKKLLRKSSVHAQLINCRLEHVRERESEREGGGESKVDFN